MANYKTFGAWLKAIEAAQTQGTHWTVEINSPITVRDGRRGHYDRWGVFREAA